MKNSQIVKNIVSLAGSQSSLGRICGIRQSNVQSWIARDGKIPLEHCITIYKHFAGKIELCDIRPDIFKRDEFIGNKKITQDLEN
jgi:DNA-binding transcriptional regulator YdaS (Cro superfamily)